MIKRHFETLPALKEFLMQSTSYQNGELEKFYDDITNYGLYGIIPSTYLLKRFEDVYHLNSLSKSVLGGRYQDIGFEPSLEDGIAAFFGRLKLDLFNKRDLPNELTQLVENKDFITLNDMINLQVKELSLLSQKHVTTIRNEYLISEKYNSHISKFNGLTLIPLEIAKEICTSIKSFVPSPAVREADQMYVPVSKDGSVFSEHCTSTNGFRIGPKGDEYSVDSYDKALADLLSMEPRAYWRRKNSKGHWGIVSVFRWEYKNKSEIYINS